MSCHLSIITIFSGLFILFHWTMFGAICHCQAGVIVNEWRSCLEWPLCWFALAFIIHVLCMALWSSSWWYVVLALALPSCGAGFGFMSEHKFGWLFKGCCSVRKHQALVTRLQVFLHPLPLPAFYLSLSLPTARPDHQCFYLSFQKKISKTKSQNLH